MIRNFLCSACRKLRRGLHNARPSPLSAFRLHSRISPDISGELTRALRSTVAAGARSQVRAALASLPRRRTPTNPYRTDTSSSYQLTAPAASRAALRSPSVRECAPGSPFGGCAASRTPAQNKSEKFSHLCAKKQLTLAPKSAKVCSTLRQ